MNVIKLAWRNLWRRKRRTAITAFSIGFGVLLAVTITGMTDYSYMNMINAGAAMGWGHITIASRGYHERPSLDNRLTEVKALGSGLLSVPGVNGVNTRIMGQAMFATARKSVGGMFIAIDPVLEPAEKNLFLRSIIEGEVFASAEGRGVVIGRKVAQKLGLKIGKKMIYTTTDVSGEIVSEIARVSAIFKTGVDEVDGTVVLLPIDRVRATLHYEAGDATLVAVTIDDPRHTGRVRDQIEARVGGRADVEVLSWRETQSDLAGLIALDRGSNYISQVLVALLIAAGIFNTLLMSVMERKKEFGVMMAIGMSPKILFQLVLIESVWMAMIGLFVGIIMTTPWYLYLYNIGLDLSASVGDDYSAGGVLVDPIFRIKLYRESAIAILGGVFSLTLFSGLYPAWRAMRIPPVESLRTL